MIGLIRSLLIVAAAMLWAGAAQAGIGSASATWTGADSATVQYSHDGYTAFADVGSGYAYEVCWKKTSNSMFVCYVNGNLTNATTHAISGLSGNTSYRIKIRCRCKKDSATSLPAYWRELAEFTYVHVEPPPPLGLVSSSTVRVRGVTGGQCLYIDPNGGYTRGWACWDDPNMRFALETWSDGHRRLRHLQSGLCLQGRSPLGTPTRATVCGMLSTRLQTLPNGSGFSIRIPLTAPIFGNGFGPPGCVRANPANGSSATTQICGTDQHQRFAFDPA